MGQRAATSFTSSFSRFVPLAACLALIGSVVVPVHAQSAAKALPGKTIEVNTPQDAWQLRRTSTLQLIGILQRKDTPKPEYEKAFKAFDDILTAFDKNPTGITPMESMDLMQVSYIPNEDNFPDQLALLALFATAGWYDALRFADESGRAEIVNNEAFFKRALMAKKDGFIAFMEKQPLEAAKAVARGIRIAEATRDTAQYDRRWPASYGLMRLQCGMEGKTSCPTPKAMPESEWPQAFKEAAARVTRYYRINKD